MSPSTPAPEESTMAGTQKLPPLTLIVATTPITSSSNQSVRRLGIGHGGTLPWPRIKADMGFFSRVTSRSPTPRCNQSNPKHAINAVIMGRKTYDSLPTRFRPLPRRLNVVITRDESGLVKERAIAEWKAARERERQKALEKQQQENINVAEGATNGAESGAAAAAAVAPSTISNSTTAQVTEAVENEPEVLVSNSIESALHTLQSEFTSQFSHGGKRQLGNIFVIGGGEIYASALRLKASNKIRVVMTDVRQRRDTEKSQIDPDELVNGFECDTFFPIDELEGNSEWRKATTTEVSEWVGESVPADWRWDGDIAIQMIGYERV